MAEGLSAEASYFMAIAVGGLLAWVAVPIPKGLISLIILCLLMLTGVVADFQGAMTGFTSQALYLFMMVGLIAQAMARSGIVPALTARVVGWVRGRLRFSLLAGAILMLLMPLGVPSGSGVSRLMIELHHELARRWDIVAGHPWFRLAILQSCALSIMAALVFATGNALNIVIFQFIQDAGQSLTWIQWAVAMGPPAAVVVMVVTAAGIAVWHIPSAPPGGAVAAAVMDPSVGGHGKMWGALAVSGLMLAGFVWNSLTGRPIIVTILLAAIALSLPPLRLTGISNLDSDDWDDFFTLGTAMTLAQLAGKTGAAAWLVQVMTEAAGSLLATHLGALLVLMAIASCIRIFIVAPVTAFSLLSSFIILYAQRTGLSPVRSALAVGLVMAGVNFFPTNSTATLVGERTGSYTRAELFLLGSILLPVSVGAAVVSYFYYWPAVGIR